MFFEPYSSAGGCVSCAEVKLARFLLFEVLRLGSCGVRGRRVPGVGLWLVDPARLPERSGNVALKNHRTARSEVNHDSTRPQAESGQNQEQLSFSADRPVSAFSATLATLQTALAEDEISPLGGACGRGQKQLRSSRGDEHLASTVS